MRILLYVHSLKPDDLLSDYVRRLARTLESHASVSVVTRSDDFQQSLDEFNPDIVHIHGCWDRYAYQLMKSAVRQGCAIVVSPHREIGTYAMHHEQRLRKIVKIADYQRRMIANCDAIAVTEDDEAEGINRLGWQKRIDIVKDSLLDHTVSDDDMSARIIWLYQKVIDSRYRKMMNADENEALRSLIYVGMKRDDKAALDSNKLLTLRSLKPVQWRHILLYGDDEDLREIIDKAAASLQLDIPPIDTNTISRYPVNNPKSMGALEGARVLGKNKKRIRRLREAVENDTQSIRTLATMLVNTDYLIRKCQLSMRQLAEFYGEIRYTDYDEQRFIEISKDLGLHKLMRRLLQIMSENMYLKEGFMPDNPIDDRVTQRIRKVIHTSYSVK